jgi:hypothetical protein
MTVMTQMTHNPPSLMNPLGTVITTLAFGAPGKVLPERGPARLRHERAPASRE